MDRLSRYFERAFPLRDLRILAVMVAGVAVFGVVDGSLWRSLLSPTLAYRPAILFGLTLVFGWRGFLWSLLLFIASFASFLAWQGAVLIAPMYVLSQAFGFVVARRLAGDGPWLARERSALAFLAGAVVAPAIPALLTGAIQVLIGVTLGPRLPAAIDSWLRGGSAIVALAPAVLVYGSGRLKEWVGLAREQEWQPSISRRNVLELGVEVTLWTATLWLTVLFKAQYSLNVIYLTFLPPLAFAILRGMRLTTLALAANAIVATTLWNQLHWAGTFSAADLRLLIALYSATILVLAAVVDERQRGRGQVEKLLTAEALLRESERHFRSLANSAPVMIWLSGKDKLCTFVNQRWVEFSGRSIEQELGDGWADGLHPEDAANFYSTYVSSFDARRTFRMEGRFRRADGEYRWVLVDGVPLYRDGQFAGYIGSCVDVTEQKLATERLEESEARLAYAQRLARVGGFERNVETNVMRWSEEKLRIMGVQNVPPNFAACLDYVHPRDKQKFLEIEKRVRSSDAPVEVEYRIVRPDGEERVLRSIIEGIKDAQGALIRVVGASQDITDQVRARDRLVESEQRLKTAQQLAQVGSWHWDLETDQVSSSEECIRIFGHPPDYQPSLEKLLERITPGDQERVAGEIKASLAERSGLSTEFQIAKPSGELRIVSFASRVSLNEDGSPRHMFGACQDVTDMRRAQEQSFTRRKLETVGTLANGIAHDFNNLLGGVLAQAELALAELDSGSIPKEQLEAIRDVAIRGSQIVRELMIYAGKESEELTAVDVSQVIKEMQGLLKVSVSKHAVVETDLASDLPAVHANSARISQLVMNLVTNASEAIGDRDGVIRVITRRVTTVSGEKGDQVRLEVSDTGCGMDPATQARVFEPFFSTKFAGRGIGLAVVDGIVRSLGGAIQLESEPGRGTTIQVLLPCAATDSDTVNGIRSEEVEPQ